jgi:hypothetical protein
MKSLAILLATTASLALASSASAYVAAAPLDVINVFNSTVNGNSVDGFIIANTSDTSPGGGMTVQGSDTLAITHTLAGNVTCLNINALGTAAGVLLQLTDNTGNPGVYGVLVHLSDPEPSNSENGVGDRLDFTNLNLKQYNRQLAAGCAPVDTPRAALSSGNISIAKGDGSILIT